MWHWRHSPSRLSTYMYFEQYLGNQRFAIHLQVIPIPKPAKDQVMSYLRYLCLFAYSGVQHIVFLFYFSSSMLPVSPDRPFLNGPSVYSNVHLSIGTVTICVCKSIERIINDGLVWFPESNGLLFESIFLCCFPYHIPIL
jgi:hypothetical protein